MLLFMKVIESEAVVMPPRNKYFMFYICSLGDI